MLRHCGADHLDHFGRHALLGSARLDPVDDLLNAPLHDGAFARRHLQLPGAIDVAEALGDEVDERRIDAVDLGRALGTCRRIPRAVSGPLISSPSSTTWPAR